MRAMLYDTCAMWLRDFRVDGLRFDSANDLPPDVIQVLLPLPLRIPGLPVLCFPFASFVGFVVLLSCLGPNIYSSWLLCSASAVLL